MKQVKFTEFLGVKGLGLLKENSNTEFEKVWEGEEFYFEADHHLKEKGYKVLEIANCNEIDGNKYVFTCKKDNKLHYFMAIQGRFI